MGDTDMLSTVATLLGEPARTRILTALLTGRAMTAKELAYFAGVTAATASSHLSRLLAGHLLTMEKQGRCHYYRLRSADVAQAIEGLMTVATIPSNGWPPLPSRRAGATGSAYVLRPHGGAPERRRVRHAPAPPPRRAR